MLKKTIGKGAKPELCIRSRQPALQSGNSNPFVIFVKTSCPLCSSNQNHLFLKGLFEQKQLLACNHESG
jgi:hypothetical protein